ncbi:MAG: exodeoxyribonuclease VII small subunit [Myxococcota bacterium]|jgi:exodeoxyribonuclease VII small subunit|nr:exodeoxyribonuclease VII small subunit [Myxococcota bacterium]
MADPHQTFEQILGSLETVVRELEQGGLPLEQALERFETGIKLAREGARRLDEAQRRVEEILEGGEIVPVRDNADG